jgi:uncharacterized protein (DUF608 family)
MQPPLGARSFDSSAVVAAFPLGGIGTGNVSLGARGNLQDWEIFNATAKGTTLPNTFFAIWARAGDADPVARVLEGPLQPPHALSHGYHPATNAGLPRMAKATLHGAYPLATVDFEDGRLPLRVSLEAYTPLVPLSPEDSGIPCAVLTYRVTNTAAEPVTLTLVGSLTNPVGGVGRDRFGNLAKGGAGRGVNELRSGGAVQGLFLRSDALAPGDRHYGDVTLATQHADISAKRAWLRGAWYDFLREFWDDLCDDGRLSDLGYETPSDEGRTDTASLALHDTLAPGATGSYTFVLAWSFPNRPNSWGKQSDALIRNHYATRFETSWHTAEHLFANHERLDRLTRRFQQSLFDSTLPAPVLQAISANIVPLRSTTCFWLEDGRFYGYEGCFDDGGCCDGTCTHVWSYAYTLAYLFPSLEREMRRIEFEIETAPDGYMAFRTYKTFGEQFIWTWGAQQPEAAVDGQMGSVLRAYREWLLSGDRAWLEGVWPGVRRAIGYASAHWDTDGDGFPDGKQHNTYDIEFYGPNPLCGIYYLAGLRATEELARVMGDDELASRCKAALERGRARAEELLWNGEYYEQRLDDVDAHPYQHGAGCLADQLLGQLHARALGLGDLVPPENERSALAAIYRHNFRRDFREHVNCQRTYVLNDEAGLIMCTWPRGGRPRFPFVYSDEVWTGIEYQVAAHLVYAGQPDAALEMVAAVQARHDGVRRNPWNEVECGHHYARSMASWAVLLALSGFGCDVSAGTLTFAPALPGPFRGFFSNGTGWGSYSQHEALSGLRCELRLDSGVVRLGELRLAGAAQTVVASRNGVAIPATVANTPQGFAVRFDRQLELSAGDVLTVYAPAG